MDSTDLLTEVPRDRGGLVTLGPVRGQLEAALQQEGVSNPSLVRWTIEDLVEAMVLQHFEEFLQDARVVGDRIWDGS